ncbi:hypothetical protein HG263_16080 [Pseudoalteromonas sp. JBTF-M23]|uniref:Uncharacterized protein n=1 Tax=Pseudoalteromonas caenipelagi TaxID=2726988 RepID=A0A849VK10_9GAMM|nr:hypothetical protein [Pseudoalteromonas caenipelagi]NOU52051.1 hypothetical protein [Pseudoalteromonas caenipelagi]
MKIQLNKKNVKNLSKGKTLPAKMTPQIGGAAPPPSYFCVTDVSRCDDGTYVTFYCV